MDSFILKREEWVLIVSNLALLSPPAAAPAHVKARTQINAAPRSPSAAPGVCTSTAVNTRAARRLASSGSTESTRQRYASTTDQVFEEICCSLNVLRCCFFRRIFSGMISRIWQLRWLLCTNDWHHKPTLTRWEEEDLYSSSKKNINAKILGQLLYTS